MVYQLPAPLFLPKGHDYIIGWFGGTQPLAGNQQTVWRIEIGGLPLRPTKVLGESL